MHQQRRRPRRPSRAGVRAALATCGAVLLTGTMLAPAASAASAAPAASAASAASAAPVPSVPAGSMVRVVDQIGARPLWEQGVTGDSVTVAVVDTGVAPVPALSGADKVVAMVDLSPEAAIPEAEYLDTFGHGTHMTGIIAGRDPVDQPAAPGERFLGVAPDARIVSVKVGDSTGGVDVSQVIAGIDWVVEHKDQLGIGVLNLSYGTDSTQDYRIDPLAHAVERAWHAGIVVVVAAGNDGRGARRLANPALDPYVIAVAAADVDDDGRVTVPHWSTSGSDTRSPDVAAPGASIISLRSPGSRLDEAFPTARVGTTLYRGSGSSQAAAVVSGAAALLLDARPTLSPDEVKALLTRTAQPFHNAQPRFQGAGLIDVAGAAASPVPAAATQEFARSDGSGSLDASRGSDPVGVPGVPLLGEQAVNGVTWGPWDGPRWSEGTWDGVRWRGVRWRGAEWAGGSWTGVRWRGDSWEGVRWRSAAWTGGSWSGASWTGASWTGAAWAGDAATDPSWTGVRWRGDLWQGSDFSGVRWR